MLINLSSHTSLLITNNANNNWKILSHSSSYIVMAGTIGSSSMIRYAKQYFRASKSWWKTSLICRSEPKNRSNEENWKQPMLRRNGPVMKVAFLCNAYEHLKKTLTFYVFNVFIFIRTFHVLGLHLWAEGLRHEMNRSMGPAPRHVHYYVMIALLTCPYQRSRLLLLKTSLSR